MLDFDWLGDGLSALASGAAVTLGLVAVVTVLGSILSVSGAAARRSSIAPLRFAVMAYVEIIRNAAFAGRRSASPRRWWRWQPRFASESVWGR